MTTPDLPDYAPIPQSALGPAVNDQGYYVGRVERNLYWVTDSVYNCAFLATRDGVVLFDAPPSIGHNLQRAIDEVTAAEGVPNTVTHLVYSHHHHDHGGAAFLFDGDVTRIGHEETKRLLLRDNDPARPLPDVTFGDRSAVVVVVVRVDEVRHLVGHPVGGGDLVHRAPYVPPDGRGRVEQHDAVPGGQERAVVDAVGDPEQVPLDAPYVVPLVVDGWAERRRRDRRVLGLVWCGHGISLGSRARARAAVRVCAADSGWPPGR